MKNVCVYIDYNESVTDETRVDIWNSLCGEPKKNKLGMLDKFVYSIGYKPICVADNLASHSSVNVVGGEYSNPCDVLYKGCYIGFKGRRVISFVLPIKTYKHADSRFSYNTQDLCKKFVSFLTKVYPRFTVTYVEEEEEKEEINILMRDEILSFFFKNIDFTGEVEYTVELSTPHMLTEMKKKSIENHLNACAELISGRKDCYTLYQGFCDVCYSYNHASPYHLELVYNS